MLLYIELWNPRQKWLDMTPEERGAYMEKVGPVMQETMSWGLEMVGWSVCKGDSAGYQYMAVWKIPDESIVHKLEEAVTQAGWHEYFEQVNSWGTLTGPDEVIGDMVQVQKA